MAGLDVVCSSTALESVDIEFHGVLYTITIRVHGEEVLTVEIEDKDTLDRWRGEFAAKYVEDITSKTGNYKKFAVFVRMLQTAVQQQSDSVFVDLLTFQDLELLKSKKAAATGTANGTAGPPRQLPASNKRYLILTYASEFDRVHYPLPLLPEDQPDPQRLKAVIKQLRQQLGEVQAAQQLQQSQIVPQPRRRSSQQQGSSVSDDHDIALLSSRVEVLTVQLERERADHRRELRRKAQELQELQGELSRSRDVVRDLRMRIKALEQQQEASALRRSSTSTTNQQQTRRSSERRPQASYGSSYLSGNSKYPSNVGKYPSRPTRTTSNISASSRGSSPASSRAQSPSYQRPWAQGSTPPRPPRPSSAPPKQRFDPTEYVRQKRAREQASTQRVGGSRGSSPVRSSSRERERISYSNASSPRVSASGVLTPRGLQSPVASTSGTRRPGSSGSNRGAAAGVNRQSSLDAQRRSSSSTGGGGYLRPTLSSSSGRGAAADAGRSSSRPGSSGRQRQQQQVGRSSSRERLGAVYGVAEGSARSRSSSRQGGRLEQQHTGREGPGAASPGRALQGVKDKLSAFMAKQQMQDQQQPQGTSPSVQPSAIAASNAHTAVVTAQQTAQPASSVPEGNNQVFESAGTELADIDQRLSALQNFLKKAKASVAAS